MKMKYKEFRQVLEEVLEHCTQHKINNFSSSAVEIYLDVAEPLPDGEVDLGHEILSLLSSLEEHLVGGDL